MGIFADNTALSYVKKQGGTFFLAVNTEAQLLLCLTEEWEIILAPQFIMGAQNVIADFLSSQHQVLGSEWTLAQDVVNSLLTQWPATVDLFAISTNYCLPVYFSPIDDPLSAGTDTFLQTWDGLQAYACENDLNWGALTPGPPPPLLGGGFAPPTHLFSNITFLN